MIEEKFIDTGKGKIAYWLKRGEAAKPTLVFLHGLSSNHLTWDPIVKIVSALGYGTLALDLRGHGHSAKTRRRDLYRIPVMGRDLKQILEAEKISNFCLIGYSYGGYVGIDLASTYPGLAKALVLISTNHVSPFKYHWYGFVNPLVRWAVNGLGWLLLWQSQRHYYYFEPERAPGYWKSTFAGYATMPLSINFWMLSEVFALDYREAVRKIVCPTLIIRGQNDNFITRREIVDLAKKIPRSEVATLGVGHFVASHYQVLTAEKILEFLQKLT